MADPVPATVLRGSRPRTSFSRRRRSLVAAALDTRHAGGGSSDDPVPSGLTYDLVKFPGRSPELLLPERPAAGSSLLAWRLSAGRETRAGIEIVAGPGHEQPKRSAGRHWQARDAGSSSSLAPVEDHSGHPERVAEGSRRIDVPSARICSTSSRRLHWVSRGTPSWEPVRA